ncbi:zinc knuckle CX2CX4HX4C containing protein [Tanacetum coccineum]
MYSRQSDTFIPWFDLSHNLKLTSSEYNTLHISDISRQKACCFNTMNDLLNCSRVKDKSANVSNIEAVKEKDLNDEHVVMEVHSPLVDHTNESSYATAIGKPSGKKVNVGTLYTLEGNGIDVVVPVDYIRAISERFANTAYGFFLGKKVAYPVVANYNNPLILKKWHLDKNLLKEDVSIVSVWVKLHGIPMMTFSEDGLGAIATKLGTPLMLDSYTSDMCMQYWGRSSAGEKKTVKKHSQTSRGVPVGPKMGFKPQKDYRPVTNKPNASSSGNKKKGVEPTIEEFTSNTPIGEKIDKIERQIYEGKLRLLDNDENPLVPTGIVESDSKVEVVFDEIANLRIPTSGKDGSDKGYGTNSLLKQWRDSYPNNDDNNPV